MSTATHPAAAEHLPSFITAPGDTDVLMVITVIILILAVAGIGVLYFRLHALPEQMAHRGEKVQFEIVAILALLALFTHNHLYWIAALLLAFIQLPDFSTPLSRMANALTAMARNREPSTRPAPAAPAEPPAPPLHSERSGKDAVAKSEEKSDA